MQPEVYVFDEFYLGHFRGRATDVTVLKLRRARDFVPRDIFTLVTGLTTRQKRVRIPGILTLTLPRLVSSSTPFWIEFAELSLGFHVSLGNSFRTCVPWELLCSRTMLTSLFCCNVVITEIPL